MPVQGVGLPGAVELWGRRRGGPFAKLGVQLGAIILELGPKTGVGKAESHEGAA